jgi:hypothetical protein
MKHLLFGLLAAAGSALAVQTGGSTGGGSDNHLLETNSAWFLGTGSIRVCMTYSPTFGASADEGWRAIEEAFRMWDSYIVQHKVYTSLAPEARLATQLSRLASCDGTEDLAFHLGTTSAEVEKEKKAFHNPTAFAARTFYDPKKHWGRGLIWLASTKTVDPGPGLAPIPDWSLPKALLGMILHEVGHVLGCGHVQGTVMMSGISQYVHSPYFQQAGVTIDLDRELAYCGYCTYEMEAKVYTAYAGVPALLKRLLGKAPNGDVMVTFRQEPRKWPEIALIRPPEANRIRLFFGPDSEVFAQSESVFKTAWGRERPTISAFRVGYAFAADRTKIPMLLEYNMESTSGGGGVHLPSPLKLTAIVDGVRVILAHFPEMKIVN